MPGSAPAFLHYVTTTTSDLYIVYRWIKDFPHQARGKLLKFAATTVLTIGRGMKAARTKHCRHRWRTG